MCIRDRSWSKWYLALGAVDAHQNILVAVLMISSLLNIAYLMPIVARAFFIAPNGSPEHEGIHEAPVLCRVALCLTAAGCIGLFFYVENLYQLLLPIVQP